MAKKENRRKGTFGDGRLTVAKSYVFPLSRKLMMIVGGIGCAVVAVYYAADAWLLRNTFISSGSLSAHHANFEQECSKCHQPFKNVLDAKCSTCHEKTNDQMGVYTFAAHYIYRSEDGNRLQTGKKNHAGDEGYCASCHPDHRGREGRITHVRDARCATCHYTSFNTDHPQFEFARTNAPDDSTLKMTHVRHTKEVMKLLKIQNIEQACLHCHNAMPDGKGFQPLDFDMHCADCHLTTATETPSLTIRNPAETISPGVETLEMIQRRKGPGTTWAFYTNPNAFTINGNKIKKSPVYHRDPWILENLKQLRRMVYADSTLADLLNAAARGARKSKQLVYKEMIETLKNYVLGLRSQPEPEIQAELTRIDSLLKEATQKVSSGAALLPDVAGMASALAMNPNLTADQRQSIEDYALKLTKPCLECHEVDHAAILSVKASQRKLMRAEFDHRAHITQRRCLECHTAIPVAQALAGDTTGIAAIDRAATQNIPAIENCFACHTKDAGSNTCVTCHFMHPNKQNRSNLQLFVERK
jgi:hypothetical protein